MIEEGVKGMGLLEEMEERVQRGDPVPGAYSGGEPEPEVSDVTQAEIAAAIIQMQQQLAFLNAKLGHDMALDNAKEDATALDGKQNDSHYQHMADLSANRANRDPLLDVRLRHVEDLHADARRQQEQGFQQTQQVSLQAIQASLDLQKSVNSVIVKDLLDSIEGTRVGRDRTWTYTEQVEASTIDHLTDAVVEAIRNTPLHPDKNQAT